MNKYLTGWIILIKWENAGRTISIVYSSVLIWDPLRSKSQACIWLILEAIS